MSDTYDYWSECIAISCEENGIALTPEQIDLIAADVQSGHENYGMAYPAPESPYPREIADLNRKLQAEREKVHCRECNGRGSITRGDSVRSSTSQCWKCRGEGRHAP